MCIFRSNVSAVSAWLCLPLFVLTYSFHVLLKLNGDGDDDVSILCWCKALAENTKEYNHLLVTGWAVAQTCCISQCAKYRKSGIFGYPWEQNH